MIQSNLFDPQADPSKGRVNQNSALAHEHLKPKKQSDRCRIWVMIGASEKVGMTQEQCALKMGKAVHKISGRFGELERLGLLTKTDGEGRTSSGEACAVYRSCGSAV